MKDKLKIGIDLHGVADLYPEQFKHWSYVWIVNGHEVHLITGSPWKDAKKTVKDLGISYSHYFSTVDYHRSIFTEMWKKDGTWWMEEKTWARSKGDYLHRERIDIHFDDQHEYANWVPDFCTFILVPKKNFILPTGGY